MVQEDININIVASVARSLYHEQIKCHPLQYNEVWTNFDQTEKNTLMEKSRSWLTQLKATSPETYKFVVENYAEVPYR